MIQSHTPVKIGTGFPPKNNVGAWSVLIPLVTNTSIWCMVHYWFRDVLPSATVMGLLNMEMGIGKSGSDPNVAGATARAWKSQLTSQGGSELEFDDSGHTKYVPFNFQKDVQISCRFAGINQSFGHNIEIQLQLFS